MKIELQDVVKDYDSTRALDNVAFSMQGGDILGVLGPNGAGKTTLLKICADLIRPSSGHVLIDDVPIKGVSLGLLGLLSPESYLYSDLTVRENLKLYSKLYKAENSAWEKCAEYFNLTDMLLKPVRELSYGQKKRASLARLMIANPKIVLLDEPFLGLDQEAEGEVEALIMKLKTEGRLIIVATHHFELASDIMDNLMILNRGKISYYENFDRKGKILSQIYNEALTNV